jgi:hypothetical protein
MRCTLAAKHKKIALAGSPSTWLAKKPSTTFERALIEIMCGIKFADRFLSGPLKGISCTLSVSVWRLTRSCLLTSKAIERIEAKPWT